MSGDTANSNTALTLAHIPQSPTLLPAPVANAISFATRTSSLALRLGSRIGAYSIDTARVTTLSSIEIARGALEGILSRAGRDVILHPASGMAAADTETILRRSLEQLHFAVMQATFWTSTSFQMTSTTLMAATDVSQLLLSSLNTLFGSTDSSRAIASIIHLIRHEFKSPASGLEAQKVGLMDLTLALGAFAYLQQACRKTGQEEARLQSQEEVIWDVVVLADGERLDVHEQSLSATPMDPHASTTQVVCGGHPERATPLIGASEQDVLDHLKGQIIDTLPAGTAVTMSSASTTLQTVTVDVHGPQPQVLPSLPGAEVIETRPLSASSSQWSIPSFNEAERSGYRIVYRIKTEKLQDTSILHSDYVARGDASETSQAQKHTSASSGLLIGPSSGSSDTSSPPLSPSILANTVGIHPSDMERGMGQATEPRNDSKPSEPNSEVDNRVKGNKASSAQHEAHAANQKRPRSPVPPTVTAVPPRKSSQGVASSSKRPKPLPTPASSSGSKLSEKKPGLKQVLKGSGQSISSIWNKDGAVETGRRLPDRQPAWNAPTVSSAAKAEPRSAASGTQRKPTGHLSTRPTMPAPETIPRSCSRASYVSVQDQRRSSIVSQTDSYSLHSPKGHRPGSPSVTRTDMAAARNVPRSEDYLTAPPLPQRRHQRRGSYVPSLYSLATNDSQTSLVLSSYYQKSAYHGSDALTKLRQEGVVDGTFPTGNLLHNITRYMRFSSASYGSNFLRLLGIGAEMPEAKVEENVSRNVRHFLHHTESDASSMLLASIVDPQGGADVNGATGAATPLVHYISLDHAAKAVVLACRGTLGFEDVLADMACDYDRLSWRGRGYRVHKGIHASARRVLLGGDGRVLVTLREALAEFPDYGLVLCGHSLGGGVTALLGIMLSEPNPHGSGFVTAQESHLGSWPQADSTSSQALVGLPAGRRIHVYAYGPPGTMSRSLSKITKGLITTIVHGKDVVPHLSLGVLHDCQALALAFRTDQDEARTEIRRRIWHNFQQSIRQRRGDTGPPSLLDDREEVEQQRWMLPALAALRGHMQGEKLMPPGEVFVIETQKVLRRDAWVVPSDGDIGRPAQRIVLKYVRDVEGRYGEMRFGTGMLFDHSPGKYEAALNRLRRGVAD